MPIRSFGTLQIDYNDEGSGELVVLVHSSVSGNRQWRALTEILKQHHRVVAVNMRGYGGTSPWPAEIPLTVDDEVDLISALLKDIQGPVHLVGHSFGGLVAMKAALSLGARVATLIAFEPNPFRLLEQHGRIEALAEIRALLDHVTQASASENWPSAAEKFVNYWQGDGSWPAMPEKRQQAFLAAMAPLIQEIGAVMRENTSTESWNQITARTLIVTAKDTRRPIAEVVDVLGATCTA